MEIKKLVKLSEQMMNELYTKATPSITWTQVKKKYGGTTIPPHEHHAISQLKSEQILDKYKKKVRTKHDKDEIAMVWLSYAPKTKKCGTCYSFGLWGIGDASPMGPMDASDGCPTKKCPECGANPNPIKQKRGKKK